MRLSVWLALALFSVPLVSFGYDAWRREPKERTGTIEELEEDSYSEDLKNSVAPVLGYDPTYGFVAGAAYFANAGRFSLGIDANTNFQKVYQAHLNLHHHFATRWQYGVTSMFMQGFDPYYGEGGDTSVSSRSRLWGTKSQSRLQVTHWLNSIVSVGLFAEFRSRSEEAAPDGSFVRTQPDEQTVGAGAIFKVDTRKDRDNPKDGFVFQTTATHVPKGLNPLAVQRDFTQLEGSFIVYKEVMEGAIPNVIAAFRLMGGYTFGPSSYMYKYRMGGADKLRGFLENRYRGDMFYLQQTELRFPLWEPVSGAAFVSFGDAADAVFSGPKVAYGMGVRIGLPPDWVSKVRIDVGYGRDEMGVFADFGHSF